MKKIRFLHRLGYATGRIVSPIALRKYGFTTDQVSDVEGPYIVMSNHLTEDDMMMLIAAFKKQMYFVCGEHLLRSKNAKALVTFFDPIPQFKGTVASGTAMEMLKRLRAGQNVMIFPEGSRSFDGETLPISLAAGKLVKTAKCPLITYHITGGYFVAPRWAKYARTGPISGKVVHIYTTAELSKMSAADITEAINRDIYENAYATQRKNPQKYVGPGLAEGLENFLIICPRCGAYDSMVTRGDAFECPCGLKGTYDEYGFLRGDALPFDSVYDWGKWIKTRFDADMEKRAGETELFHEKDVTLYEITPDHRRVDLGTGELTVRHDSVSMCGYDFPFSGIPAMSMLYYGKTLLFNYEGRHWGVTGETFHAWKSNRLFDLYKAAESGEPLA